MYRFLPALVAVFLCLNVPANAWELDAMNRTIDGTNFIVDDKCSGTLVDLEQRLILTNHHCVDARIRRETIEQVDSDGTIHKVERRIYKTVPVSQRSYANFEEVGSATYITDIVAEDEDRDLALIQIKAASIPHTFSTQLLPVGVDIVRGEQVYAVGNPYLLDASVTRGIISNLARKLRVGGQEHEYLQMSAPIFGGNSGGALYNDVGQMVGIPAASAAGGGSLAFAIRIDTIREFLDENCFSAVYDPTTGVERDNECVADRDKREAE